MRISDWSSDVCSSDLPRGNVLAPKRRKARQRRAFPCVRREYVAIRVKLAQRSASSASGPVIISSATLSVCPRIAFSSRSAISGFSRSEEHTSELQSLMSISYDAFCLKTKKQSQDRDYYQLYYTTQLRFT